MKSPTPAGDAAGIDRRASGIQLAVLPGVSKEAYRLTFSSEERAPIRRLKDGLLRALPEPTPIQGKNLALSEQLFEDDRGHSGSACQHIGALRGRSRSIDRRVLAGISRARRVVELGAPLLCIEPWHGFCQSRGFRRRIHRQARPDCKIAPARHRVLSYRIRVG